MANYYNVTAYKHTGFTALHRPARPAVLEAITDKAYIEGLALNRYDMPSIQSIDLQGSVKDVAGNQLNNPNSTGSHGPNGPFYNWEEVDYLRLVRTGYPGDTDFIDITNNMTDPWNATKTAEQKTLRVAYYFVTRLEPLSRNVTRLYLEYDPWLSAGGLDSVTLEGYKIRGHITDAEDASSFNMTDEGVTQTQPLEVSGYTEVGQSTLGLNPNAFIATSVDLDTIDKTGITVTDGSGSQTFPKIPAVSVDTNVVLNLPGGDITSNYLKNMAFYKLDEKLEALTLLNSMSSVNLSASYNVPVPYASLGSAVLTGLAQKVDNPSPRNIGSYPRKADYYWGTDLLISTGSGTVASMAFSEVSDRSIGIWANPLPGGSPLARFTSIKSKNNIWDGAIAGSSWQEVTVTLDSVAGFYWTQANYYNQKAATQMSIAQRQTSFNSNITEQQLTIASGTSNTAMNVAGGMVAAGLAVATGGAALVAMPQAFSMINSFGSYGADMAKAKNQMNYLNNSERLSQQSDLITQQQQLMGIQQTSLSGPTMAFTATPAESLIRDNRFATATCNASKQDRQRLRDYLKQYGYSGLYKPLSGNIEVKSKVNFTQAVSVHATHSYLPHRDLEAIEQIFTTGVFLWNTAVDYAAFDNNPDA